MMAAVNPANPPPVKAKGPPPPVPKKPAFLTKDVLIPPKNLPVPPKNLPVPPKNLPVPPKVYDKINNSLRDELNRKLSTHLTLPVPNKDSNRNLNLPKTPDFKSGNNGSNSQQNKIKDELQNIFAKRNEMNYKEDKFSSNNQQSVIDSSLSAPKVDQGSSLTHVTKIIENPKETSDLDNTLDLSLTDNPFDATQSHGDELNIQFTNDNTDELLDDLPMVLPPPDMSMFDDDSEESEENDNDNQDFISPDISASDEVYDVNIFLPPPPPVLYDSDEESYSENFEQIPDFVDSDDDSSNIEDRKEEESETNTLEDQHSTDVLTNNNTSINGVQTEDIPYHHTITEDIPYHHTIPEVPTITIDTVNNSNSNINNINEQSKTTDELPSVKEKTKSFENKQIDPPVNSSIKDMKENPRIITHTPPSNINNDISNVKTTPFKSIIKSPPITPSITPSIGVVKNPSHANNINNILKKQLSNPGTPIKISDYKKSFQYDSDNNKGPIVTSGRSTPGLELDSGFSTARSQDGSVSDRNHNGTVNDKNHSRSNKLEESLFTALPAVDNPSNTDNKSPASNRVSQAFSSSSESSTDSDDELGPPKMNLRNMLLQHMKNNDTDSDDSDDDFKLENQEKEKGMGDVDGNNQYGTDTETRLNEVDVVDWRVEDVCEWLELIGFSYLRAAFAKKMVTGKMLVNPNLKILDQIRFENPEDREIIQSEISALQITNDEEMEMAILDALDKAYTIERDEIFANMNGNVQHERNIQHRGSQGNIKVSKIPIRTPNVTLDETNSRDISADYRLEGDSTSLTSKEDLKKKLGADVYDPDDDEAKGNEMTDSNEQLKVKKKSKKKGFFSSLRKKSKRDQSAVTDDQMQAIVQSNPKGMVSITYLPPNGGGEMEIKLLISMNTTSREVCNLCLDHLGLNEDLRCFFLVVSRKNKKGQNMDLNPVDPPLMFQCKWSDDDKHRFELRHKYDGHIVVNSENIEQQEMVTCKLGISAQSTAKDIIPVLLKVFKDKEERKYFCLVQGEKDNRITDNCVLLDLPLNGQKCHVFKLINCSPNYLKQRKVSYNDAKKVDTKVSLLEKQVDKLSTLNEEYRRTEEQLSKENEKLNMEVRMQEEEVHNKSNDVKILQDQISTLTQKLRLSSSPLSDYPLKDENEKQKQKINEQQYTLKNLEQSMKTLKDAKSNVEKELEDTRNKCQKLENSTEEMKEQVEQLRAEKRNKVTDNTEHMNKLYSENKEYLKCMRNLEDKLAEAEQRLSELQLGHDVESTEELAELRNRIDSLDSSSLAKDTRILELEFKMQQKERDLKDMRDQWEDECRKNRKEVEMKENAESRCEDVSIKLDNLRLQTTEKDNQVQNLKAQNTKLEKKLNKQKYIMENERNVKSQETHEINKRHQDELNVLLEKVQSADKLLAENDLNIKQLAFDLTKDKEDLTQTNADLEKKLAAKDIILDRLESKIAKADLNLSTKLQDQDELLRSKEEKVQRVELEIARLENEHAAKIREMSNTLRAKDGVITKMEARFRKLEMTSGDNVKKFEKYVSEKDRLLQQVTSDNDKTSKDLKFRVRELEESLNEKDKKLREAMRQYGEIKTTTDARLKKREKEYKRQKFLLEKVLKLVSDKAPSLLRQLHESLDGDNASLDNMKTSSSSPREGVIRDEWC